MSDERHPSDDDGAGDIGVLRRLRELEQHSADLEVRLLEQEHRLFPLWRNWFRYRRTPPTGATPLELRQWDERRRSTRWALLWRLVSPETVTTAGVSVVAVLGLVVAVWANDLFREQNRKFGRQNELVALQNQYFREQNEKLQKQISAQAEETYRVRRAALVGALYDRQDCRRESAAEECPFRSSIRAREDALRAFVQVERTAQRTSAASAGDRGIDLAALVLMPWARVGDLDLATADLEDSDLSGARMAGANLRRARLKGSVLELADLRNADMREVNGVAATFDGADISGADLTGAALGAASMKGTRCSTETRLPNGLECRGFWVVCAPEAPVDCDSPYDFSAARTRLSLLREVPLPLERKWQREGITP